MQWLILVLCFVFVYIITTVIKRSNKKKKNENPLKTVEQKNNCNNTVFGESSVLPSLPSEKSENCDIEPVRLINNDELSTPMKSNRYVLVSNKNRSVEYDEIKKRNDKLSQSIFDMQQSENMHVVLSSKRAVDKLLIWFKKYEKKDIIVRIVGDIDSKCEEIDNIFNYSLVKVSTSIYNSYREKTSKLKRVSTIQKYALDAIRNLKFCKSSLANKANNYIECLSKIDNQIDYIFRKDSGDLISVDIKEFKDKYKSAIDIDTYTEMQSFSLKGENIYFISSYVLDEIKYKHFQIQKLNYNISQTVLNNKEAIQLEKEGRIDDAIKRFEENIALRTRAKRTYEHLIHIYREKNDLENELRVLNTAIEVYMKENEFRSKIAIERFPEYEQEIKSALQTNENVRGENNRYIFVQYPTFDYMSRVCEIKSLINL